MTILNIMLGRKRGGIEQALLDYGEALALAGYPYFNIVHPDGWARQQCDALGLPYATLAPRGAWDVFAAWKLRRLAREVGANAAICHGNRALSLALRALKHCPVIAVAHNYQTKRFARADACFAITQHALEALAAAGINRRRLFFMPNMVRVGSMPARPAMRTPPIIGSMGRFVAKKAFDLYIDALAELHKRGVAFQAILGGGGDDEEALRARITRHGLEEHLAMPGWVQDKHVFLHGIDVFVLPSHHEPFGIVLIEAMAAGVPVVSTASEGPREIIQSGTTGLLTPLGDASALADGLQKLLENPALASKLGAAGHAHVAHHYTASAMAARLKSALGAILTGN